MTHPTFWDLVSTSVKGQCNVDSHGTPTLLLLQDAVGAKQALCQTLPFSQMLAEEVRLNPAI